MAPKTIGDLWRDNARKAAGLPDWDETVTKSKVYPKLRTWPDPARPGSKDILDNYSTHAWQRAISSKVATDVARTRLVLYKRKKAGARGLKRSELARAAAMGDMEPIEEHPILDLLAKPNPVMSGFVARKVTQIWLDMNGEAFWAKERNLLGHPVQYWPMAPYWCTQLPTAQNHFFKFVFRSWFAQMDPSEVVWFLDPDPSNPYARGSGLGMAMSQEFDADDYAASMLAAKFKNRLMPESFLSLMDATPEQAIELEARLRQQHGGPDNYGGVHVANKELKLEMVDAKFADNQLAELRADLRDTCIQLWGVPPEVFGIVENSNRATIDAADFLYSKNCQVPRLDALCDHLQEQVVLEFADDLELGYVNPVPADREFALKVFAAAPPAFTVNDWRDLADRPDLADPKQGELHIIPGLVKELTDDLSSVEQAPPPVLAPPGGKPPVDAPPRWARDIGHEKRIRAAQEAAMRAMRHDVVIPMLREQRSRAIKAAASGAREEEEGGDLGQAVRKDEADWAATYAPLAARNVTTGALIGTAEVAHDVLMATDPAVLEYAATAAARYVTNVNETTIDRLRALITEGLAEGDSLSGIASAIAAEFDAWTGDDGSDLDRTRAMTIARTEVVAAQNYGIQIGLERVPGVRAKAWMTVGDDYVRDSHAAIDGEEAPLLGSFSNGLRWPGDLEMGDPAEVVNCRCSLRPVWEN